MIFTKTRRVICPAQKPGDAGIDFFIPRGFTPQYVEPGKDILIPSGIKVVVPEGHVLIAFNKSGVVTKKGLTVGACVVDSGYRGEVHIHLMNQSRDIVLLQPDDKIVQFVLLPYVHGFLQEVPQLKYNEYANTERGEGGFGSTDK